MNGDALVLAIHLDGPGVIPYLHFLAYIFPGNTIIPPFFPELDVIVPLDGQYDPLFEEQGSGRKLTQ
jgi:hypothetical protein